MQALYVICINREYFSVTDLRFGKLPRSMLAQRQSEKFRNPTIGAHASRLCGACHNPLPFPQQGAAPLDFTLPRGFTNDPTAHIACRWRARLSKAARATSNNQE